MDIGEEKRVIEVIPLEEPATAPVPEPEPVKEPEPVGAPA